MRSRQIAQRSTWHAARFTTASTAAPRHKNRTRPAYTAVAAAASGQGECTAEPRCWAIAEPVAVVGGDLTSLRHGHPNSDCGSPPSRGRCASLRPAPSGPPRSRFNMREIRALQGSRRSARDTRCAVTAGPEHGPVTGLGTIGAPLDYIWSISPPATASWLLRHRWSITMRAAGRRSQLVVASGCVHSHDLRR